MTKILFLIILVGITLSPIHAAQEISDAQKKEFIELLKTLPSKGEFYTEEAGRRAGPYLPVLFSLTEKEVEKDALYAFVAISVGIAADQERRAYAVSHFGEIRHPDLKLFWAAMLFNLDAASPGIVHYLRDALNSEAQARELRSMVGPKFKFFKRAIGKHPFSQDGSQANRVFEEEEGHADWVESVAFSPDNKTLLTGSHDGTMILWDVVTSKQLRSIEGHREGERSATVNSVAFSPDGKTIAFESQTGMDPFAPGIINVWDISTGKELRRMVGHQNRVSSLVFSADGKLLASGSWDKTVKLWDVSSGQQIRNFPAEKK